MKPLFSPPGRRALDQFPLHKTLLAFDFDGTLAPLKKDPDAVHTYAEFLAPLTALKSRTKIAVISGRGLKDLKPRLHFSVDFLAGNHGLEGVPEFADRAAHARAISKKWARTLNTAIAGRDRGLFVEDKTYSLSLHYRNTRNKISARAWFKREIARLEPAPRVIPGKLLFNLVPRGAPHKGTALKQMMKSAGCTRAIFLGDDHTDEDVFNDPASKSGRVLSVRVGPSTRSAAPYFLRGHKDVGRLLNCLLEMGDRA